MWSVCWVRDQSTSENIVQIPLTDVDFYIASHITPIIPSPFFCFVERIRAIESKIKRSSGVFSRYV